MARKCTSSALMALAIVSTAVGSAQAQGVSGNTIWHFLGIPQGVDKVYDANANRTGNRPGLERQPPLKSIADPSNLDPNTPAGQNPQITTAAKIKQQEDLKKQKIKAIKYLATVGCGCYPGVDKALMAALDDCTEEVRLAAAQAIGEAAQNHCKTCSKNCCCNKEMSEKLAKVAFDRDDCGCYVEQSEDVREAAIAALKICCPHWGPYTPENVPSPGPTPPPEVKRPDDRTPPPESVMPNTPPEAAPSLPPGSPPRLPTPLPPVPTPADKNSQATGRGRTPAPVLVRNAQGQWITIVNANVKPTIVPSAPAAARPADEPLLKLTVEPGTQPTAVEKAPNDSMPAAPTDTSSGSLESDFSATGNEQHPVVVMALRHGMPPAELYADSQAAALPAASATPMKKPVIVQASTQFEGPRQVAAIPAASAIPAAPAAPSASATVQGKIAELDWKTHTVKMTFAKGRQPAVGTLVKVNHAFVLGVSEVGALEIVSSRDGEAVGQPVGNLSFGHMSRDDDVTFHQATISQEQPHAVSAAPQAGG